MTEGNTRFDSHAACVCKHRTAKQAALRRFIVAAFIGITSNSFDYSWRNVAGKVVH